MAKKFFLFFVLVLLISSCKAENDFQHQRAEYKFSEKDTLEYLTMNSDLICVLEISESLKNDKDDLKYSFKMKVKRAKVYQILKGDEIETENIFISNIPVYDSPDTIHTRMSLRDGNYIAFLSKKESEYKPLTPYSLIEIYSSSNNGRPIWKQRDSKYIDIPSIPKDIIIQEIISVLKSEE